jgi:hypothetical protein
VGIGSEKPEFFGGKSECGVQAFPPVKAHLLALGLGLAAAISVGQETSSQRLENAQRGMAGASWPKKPDNRLSPLSGKMKETSEISPRFYGSGKEFQAPRLDHVQKQAAHGQKPAWEGGAARGWEQVRWQQVDSSSFGAKRSERFEPSAAVQDQRSWQFEEVARKDAPDWSSRVTRTVQKSDGTLRMYEGRLTRVREQVWREEENQRDLGPGRQEKFRPEEVEKMLSQPVGEFRGAATERSPAASPLAAADN